MINLSFYEHLLVIGQHLYTHCVFHPRIIFYYWSFIFALFVLLVFEWEFFIGVYSLPKFMAYIEIKKCTLEGTLKSALGFSLPTLFGYYHGNCETSALRLLHIANSSHWKKKQQPSIDIVFSHSLSFWVILHFSFFFTLQIQCFMFIFRGHKQEKGFKGWEENNWP